MKVSVSIKKIVLTILLCFGACACFAAEDFQVQLGQDYLIETDKNVSYSLVADPSILTLSPFFTIFNEKNVLLLHPQKVGKTNFTVFLDGPDLTFNVVVKSTPVNFKTISKSDYEIMLLDAPPNIFIPNLAPKIEPVEVTK